MKICFPVDKDKAQKSKVRDRFGGAPFYIVYDDSSKEFVTVKNEDLEHESNQCNPMASFQKTKIDAVVVGGIGSPAVAKFNQAGVKVYKGIVGTVAENIVQFNQVGMSEFSSETSCQGDKGCCS